MKVTDFEVVAPDLFRAISFIGRQHNVVGAGGGYYEPAVTFLSDKLEPVTRISETRFMWMESSGMVERCYSVSEDGESVTQIFED